MDEKARCEEAKKRAPNFVTYGESPGKNVRSRRLWKRISEFEMIRLEYEYIYHFTTGGHAYWEK